jgi:hypothetical protein
MIGLTDGIDLALASPLPGASRWPTVWRPGNHDFWKRFRSAGDMCGWCGSPESAHVAPAPSTPAINSGEANTMKDILRPLTERL